MKFWQILLVLTILVIPVSATTYVNYYPNGLPTATFNLNSGVDLTYPGGITSGAQRDAFCLANWPTYSSAEIWYFWGDDYNPNTQNPLLIYAPQAINNPALGFFANTTGQNNIYQSFPAMPYHIAHPPASNISFTTVRCNVGTVGYQYTNAYLSNEFLAAYNTALQTAADFTISNQTGNTPLFTVYTDTSTGSLSGYNWTKSDGSHAFTQNTSETIATAGIYTITHCVWNNVGSNCKNKTVTVTANGAYFSGQVFNGENATALSGVNIDIKQNGNGGTVTSGASGIWNSTYGFNINTPLAFNATKSGYTQLVSSYTPVIGGNYIVNLVMYPITSNYTPGGGGGGGASGSGTIEGEALLYPLNNPVSGATVYINNATWSNSMATSAAGNYYFINLKPGTYTIYSTSSYGTSPTASVLAIANTVQYQNLVFSTTYPVQFVVRDGANSNIITNASITVSGSGSGVSTTNSSGMASFNSIYGTMNYYVHASGYYDASGAAGISGAQTITVLMTATTSSSSNNVIWTPHQVVFQVLDADRNPILHTPFNASAIASTIPGGLTGGLQYFENTYGASPAAAAAMLASNTTYSGSTDDSGYVDVQMVGTIEYNVTVIDVNKANYTIGIWPQDIYYQIVTLNATSTNPVRAMQTYGTIMQNSYYVANFTEPDRFNGTMWIWVYDSTGKTTNINAWWKCEDNQTIWWDNVSGSGAVFSKTVPIVPFEQWKWGAITS